MRQTTTETDLVQNKQEQVLCGIAEITLSKVHGCSPAKVQNML